MAKFQFLCSNHRRWLADNPEAANRTWRESYSRSLDLVEEYDYAQAISYAGAAFETADIVLRQSGQKTSSAIRLFASSCVLLTQLLYAQKQGEVARAVLAASLARFEQLLVLGTHRSEVLAGCAELLKIGERPDCRDDLFSGRASTTAASSQIH